MANKVCVYAICKNEEKNIDKWVEYVNDADMVCLIDTGSEDKTVEKIKRYYEAGLIHVYDSISINPFSFCQARNYAYQKAYEYIMKNEDNLNEIENWAFISIDLDEFIEPGGIDAIREAWDFKNYDTIELGVRSICFDENGKRYVESQSFVHHKVHSWRFKWVRDVHEIIQFDDNSKSESEWRVKNINVYYEHIQDKQKPRDYYLMLKLAFIKGDNSSKTLIYLCWEAYNHNDIAEVYNYAKLGLIRCYNDENDENYMDYQYIICFKRYLYIYYLNKEFYKEAYKELSECIDIFSADKFPRTRLIYREIARVAWHFDKQKSIMYYHAFNDINCPEEYWVEDFNLYKPEEIAINYMELSNAYYYGFAAEKDYRNMAAMYAEKAYELDPNNETIKSNYEFFKNSFS